MGPDSDIVPGMTVDAPVAEGDEEDCEVSVGVCLAVHAATKSPVKSAGNSGDTYLPIFSFNSNSLSSILGYRTYSIPGCERMTARPAGHPALSQDGMIRRCRVRPAA